MGSDIRDEEIYKNESMAKGYQNLFVITTNLMMAPWLYKRLMRYFYGYSNRILGEENSKIRALIRKVCWERCENYLILKSILFR